MSLKEYQKKRDFSRTSEPKDTRSRKGSGPIYVIQKHDASRLHYDLRLEEKGALSSWAVPKTPPTKGGEKRLAVRTEDHPLDYAYFEGTIPEPLYGAGTVEIWDRGTFAPVEMTDEKKIIEIAGRRLKGRFALIKIKPRKGEKDINWIFFKMKSKVKS